MEYRNDFDDTTNYDTSFKVLDAYDYSSISTIDVKRSLFDLSVNGNGSLIALVEDQPSYETKSETFVKIYCVGMKKTEQDEEVCDMNTENLVNNSSSNQLPNLTRLYENSGASDGGMGRTTGREGASISLFGTTAASGNGGVGGHAAPRPRAAGGVNDVGVGNGNGGGGGGGNGAVGNGGANAIEARNANQFAIRWHGNNVEIVPPHLVGQRQRQSQIQPQPQPRNHHHHQQNRTINNSNNNNNNRDADLRAALAPDPIEGVGGGGGGVGNAGNGGAGAAQADVNNDLYDDLFDLDDIAINILSLLVGR
ncbi:uncharacterized PE-PGRS family protein PE_PGRS3-like [Lucilia sericata]|uniref:uncharacterized PE-PGRS family protein PE_PGRS3-like n=1 Tax=Lucilia sericata TaxID=13632 RepID=UPI0018A87E8C|nr:uncharacterized PE-PGRS family protein PE_PGRS3-like [Lucilia sericata]